MNILITGGAGYIGSELTDFFLKSGHKVKVVDTLEYGPTSLLRYVSNPNFDFDKLDVRRRDLLKADLDWSNYHSACLFGWFPIMSRPSTRSC